MDRYSFTIKTKANSGARTFFTSYLANDTTALALATGLEPMLANNAKVQVSKVIKDVSEQQYELPDPADMSDEKEYKIYFGNSENASIFLGFTIGCLNPANDIHDWVSTLMVAAHTQSEGTVNKIIKQSSNDYQVVR